ncbi:MAG: hypothetical protein ABI426_04320 [Flavobacterium sp.]
MLQHRTITKAEQNFISFKIDGKWSANEFTAFFQSILILYELHKILELNKKAGFNYFTENVISINGELYFKIGFNNFEVIDTPEDKLIQKIFGDRLTYLENLNYSSDLHIMKIQFASPGHSDFFGISAIIKEAFKTIRHYLPNKADKVKTEIQEQVLLKKKIENLKAIGYTKKEIKLLLQSGEYSINTLLTLNSKGKLIDAELIELKN